MAKDKNSFILYTDLIGTVSKLPDDKAGQLFKIILDYVNDLNPQVDDILLQVAFEPVKQQLKRDLKKWEGEKVSRSEAGRVGGQRSGEARRSKTKQNEATLQFASKNEANEAVTVTVNVTDTVTERENTGAPADLSNSNLFRKPVIPTKQQVWESFSLAGGTKEMAKSFYEKYEATGWYARGSPITNFVPLVQSYITNWRDNEKKKGNSTDVPTGPPLRKL